MAKKFRALAVAGGVMMAMTISAPLWAQKQGSILRQYMIDSPASMSIHEEATPVATRPVMAVFNNLVMLDERAPQNSLASIIPDLATGWSWNEDGTELTFPLRQGVAWHDGKPFTAKDVKCTWDLVGRQGRREAADQSAQAVVPQPRRSRCKRRFRGYLPSEAATTGVYCGFGVRIVSSLPVPRLATRHAHPSNRHGPVQVRRFQAQ